MNSNNIIYLVESDQKLSDNLLRSITRNFPDKKVMRFASNREVLMASKKRRPCVMLFSAANKDHDASFLDVISLNQENILENKIEFILLGTRTELKLCEDEIIKNELLTIPKPLRIPVLLEMIDGCFSRADLNKISFINLSMGEYLFREGEKADAIYILKQGKLAVEVNQKGKPFRLKEIEVQDMVGEMSFVDNSPRSADVIALESSEVVKLDLGDFKDYLEKQSIWVRLIINTLNQRLREANAKIMGLKKPS